MATTTSATGNVRLGGVRFSVHDDGHPVSGDLGLSDHRPRAAHELAIQRAHPDLDRLLFRPPAWPMRMPCGLKP